MGLDDSPNQVQLSGPEAMIPRKLQAFQPEFAGPLLPFHMYVRWLIAVELVKKNRYGPGIPLIRGIQKCPLP